MTQAQHSSFCLFQCVYEVFECIYCYTKRVCVNFFILLNVEGVHTARWYILELVIGLYFDVDSISTRRRNRVHVEIESI